MKKLIVSLAFLAAFTICFLGILNSNLTEIDKAGLSVFFCILASVGTAVVIGVLNDK